MVNKDVYLCSVPVAHEAWL